MSLLSHQMVSNSYLPNGVHPNFVTSVQLCFTCTQVRAPLECTSFVLELQSLASNTKAKLDILEVICQLLRVNCGSLKSLVREYDNLPFCPSCLKVITEIIILREKLFKIEANIRNKLSKLEAFVAQCFQTSENETNENVYDEFLLKYDDLRSTFQKKVMKEYLNKELLQRKILEMNQNTNVLITESIPSMVQLNLDKNVFSIVDWKPSLEVSTIEFPIPLAMTDASTDTKNLETSKEKIEAFRNAEFGAFEKDDDDADDDEKPPVLEVQGNCTSIQISDFEENFSLVPAMTEVNVSDDSDYGSPSKKSKTEITQVKERPQLMKNQRRRKAVLVAKKKLFTKTKNKKSCKTLGSEVCWKDILVKNTKVNPVPTNTSENQKTQKSMIDDSGEECEDDEGECSGWLIEKQDSSESSSSDSDREEPELEERDEKNVDAQDKPEDTTAVSILEICKRLPTSDNYKKHKFKPKHSLQSAPNQNKPKYVRLIQQEAAFTAKDKTVWTTKEPNQRRRIRAHKILKEDGGLEGPAQDSSLSPTELFKLMFPPAIVETIVKHTNSYARHMHIKNPKKNKLGDVIKWSPVTVEEIYAYIGILLYLGVDKKGNTSYKEVWTLEERYAIPVVVATMGRDRFVKIQSFLRFDDKVARMTSSDEKEIEDDGDSKFRYVSEIFEPFVENMQTHLRPYDTLIVDEMLVKFRGSAKFRVYMKSKPGKYGIKFWAVCDVETGYILKIALYEGKVCDQVEREHGKKVVLNLVKKYFGSGRGVTMDNFFTSKALGEELIKQKMSMLGTLNHNRMDVIPQFVDPKGRELESSVFAFQGDFTMVSYVPKKNRTVLLLSTQHHSTQIDPERKNKPRMILDYNSTKGGVDTADQMIATYSCQRSTARWPIKVFQSLLDIAAFNAYVVYKIHKSSADVTPVSNMRKTFLRKLSEGLMEPLISTRAQRFPMSQWFVHRAIAKLGFACNSSGQATDNNSGLVPQGGPRRIRCHFCVGQRSVTRRSCTSCKMQLCANCGVTGFHCPKCYQQMFKSPRKNIFQPEVRKDYSKN